MSRRRIMLALVTLGTAALLAAACGGDDEAAAPPAEPAPAEPAPAEPPAEPPAAGGGTLTASVGPGFEISLTQDGAAVSELPAGTYTIEVSDKSDIHNFHLTGGGVDEATDVGEVADTTWEVELAAGDYTFVCDPHASTMKGAFTVS